MAKNLVAFGWMVRDIFHPGREFGQKATVCCRVAVGGTGLALDIWVPCCRRAGRGGRRCGAMWCCSCRLASCTRVPLGSAVGTRAALSAAVSVRMIFEVADSGAARDINRSGCAGGAHRFCRGEEGPGQVVGKCQAEGRGHCFRNLVKIVEELCGGVVEHRGLLHTLEEHSGLFAVRILAIALELAPVEFLELAGEFVWCGALLDGRWSAELANVLRRN